MEMARDWAFSVAVHFFVFEGGPNDGVSGWWREGKGEWKEECGEEGPG